MKCAARSEEPILTEARRGVLALHRDGYVDSYGYFDLSPEAESSLGPGENILAVHCQQTTGAQYIDVGLYDMRNIIDDNHPLVFPGLCELSAPGDPIAVLVQYSGQSRNRARRGRLELRQ